MVVVDGKEVKNEGGVNWDKAADLEAGRQTLV